MPITRSLRQLRPNVFQVVVTNVASGCFNIPAVLVREADGTKVYTGDPESDEAPRLLATRPGLNIIQVAGLLAGGSLDDERFSWKRETTACGHCGAVPVGKGCYHICHNSDFYYTPEQERADEANYDRSEYYREGGFDDPDYYPEG